MFNEATGIPIASLFILVILHFLFHAADKARAFLSFFTC